MRTSYARKIIHTRTACQLTVIYKMHVHANRHVLPSLCRPPLIVPVLPHAPLGIGRSLVILNIKWHFTAELIFENTPGTVKSINIRYIW